MVCDEMKLALERDDDQGDSLMLMLPVMIHAGEGGALTSPVVIHMRAGCPEEKEELYRDHAMWMQAFFWPFFEFVTLKGESDPSTFGLASEGPTPSQLDYRRAWKELGATISIDSGLVQDEHAAVVAARYPMKAWLKYAPRPPLAKDIFRVVCLKVSFDK